jgi:hypothetical protein
MATNIPRDPPPEQPTEVAPLIVYSAPSSSGSLAGVQIIGYRSSVGGTVQAWAQSAQFQDQESFANTLGREISTFTGSGWLVGITPTFGYWHGVL